MELFSDKTRHNDMGNNSVASNIFQLGTILHFNVLHYNPSAYKRLLQSVIILAKFYSWTFIFKVLFQHIEDQWNINPRIS